MSLGDCHSTLALCHWCQFLHRCSNSLERNTMTDLDRLAIYHTESSVPASSSVAHVDCKVSAGSCYFWDFRFPFIVTRHILWNTPAWLQVQLHNWSFVSSAACSLWRCLLSSLLWSTCIQFLVIYWVVLGLQWLQKLLGYRILHSPQSSCYYCCVI